MSERHLDHDLTALKEELLAMAGHVERALGHAIDALLKWDPTQIAVVAESEQKINQAHIRVDEDCVKLLALQQPLAADLRLIIAILKINTDLERMGDQAMNIAQNAEHYLRGKPIKTLVDLPQMALQVRTMVHDALNAFVAGDIEAAQRILDLDDAVDEAKSRIFRKLVDHMKQSPQDIEQAVTLILIARNLERLGDHATNIAEEIIYVITARDIRHAGSRGPA